MAPGCTGPASSAKWGYPSRPLPLPGGLCEVSQPCEVFFSETNAGTGSDGMEVKAFRHPAETQGTSESRVSGETF